MKEILIRFGCGLCVCGAGALFVHTVPEVAVGLLKFCAITAAIYVIGMVAEGILAEYGSLLWYDMKEKARKWHERRS